MNAPDATTSVESLAAHDAEAAFHEHVMRKAVLARDRYGPCIGPDQLAAMLEDAEIVRYPTKLEFDSAFLEPGEFAWPKPLGFHPQDGFCLFLHPCFKACRESWPLLVAYHIPSINYGNLADHRHAELFAATLLNMEPDVYYRSLCILADGIPRPGSASQPAW